MLSKIYGEAMCSHSNLPFTVIRPHNFYGPRMGLAHVIPELFKKAYFAKNNKITVYSPKHKRNFCYIDEYNLHEVYNYYFLKFLTNY